MANLPMLGFYDLSINSLIHGRLNEILRFAPHKRDQAGECNFRKIKAQKCFFLSCRQDNLKDTLI